MTIELLQGDNKFQMKSIRRSVDCLYADCIYTEKDFSWASIAYEKLSDQGMFILQTDYHTVAEWKIYLDSLFGTQNLVNWISVEFDWGGRSRRSFAKKTDFILIYSKGKDYKFYPERVEIPKATAGTRLDKKGTGVKIPTDFWDDMSFSTLSKERVKDKTGRNIQWQKSLKQMDRLLLPFTDKGDLVVDTFLGSGTTGVWCLKNDRDFIGIEYDKEVFELARQRIYIESNNADLQYRYVE